MSMLVLTRSGGPGKAACISHSREFLTSVSPHEQALFTPLGEHFLPSFTSKGKQTHPCVL